MPYWMLILDKVILIHLRNGHFSYNPKIHYRVYRISILSHLNPIHNLEPNLFRIKFSPLFLLETD